MNKFTDSEKARFYDALKEELSWRIPAAEKEVNDPRFKGCCTYTYELTLKWIDAFLGDYFGVTHKGEKNDYR